MNDFTKEELQILFLEMNISINRHKDLIKVALSYQSLKDKIESMIDDYCEHDWKKGVHLFNDIYCTKCPKHFEVTNCEHEWRCWDDEHNTRECMKCNERRTGEI